MNPTTISKRLQDFEDYSHKSDGVEFWYARDLQILLEYSKWENFLKVIEKAKDACKNAGFEILDHFPELRKTIAMPKGAQKEILDFALTRYACYLVAQNGDSKKESIAFAQSYFAVQTRKQELIEERIALKKD
jgi:DNA-damage-inducible protein D